MMQSRIQSDFEPEVGPLPRKEMRIQIGTNQKVVSVHPKVVPERPVGLCFRGPQWLFCTLNSTILDHICAPTLSFCSTGLSKFRPVPNVGPVAS